MIERLLNFMAEKYGEVPPKFTKKWWEYFWDYYKWHTIITAFAVICVAVTAVQCATRERFDLNMMYAGNMYYGEDNTAAITSQLEELIDDIDENGEKNIYFSHLVFSNQPGQEEYDYAMKTKLDLSFQEDCTFLYLLDKDIMENMIKNGYAGDVYVPVSEWALGFNGETVAADDGVAYAVPLKDSKFFNENSYSCENLYLLVRGNFKEDEKNAAAYESSLRIAQKLIE